MLSGQRYQAAPCHLVRVCHDGAVGEQGMVETLVDGMSQLPRSVAAKALGACIALRTAIKLVR